MEFFEWKPEYLTGVWELDAHHKKLVSMVNNVYEEMVRCKNVDEKIPFIMKMVNELIDYGCYHFEAEERLMLKYKFPEYELHKIEHEKFKVEVKRFLKEYSEGNLVFSFPILTFLREWLIEHVTGTDMLYGPFLSEKMK